MGWLLYDFEIFSASFTLGCDLYAVYLAGQKTVSDDKSKIAIFAMSMVGYVSNFVNLKLLIRSGLWLKTIVEKLSTTSEIGKLLILKALKITRKSFFLSS
ncbi:hypothetical protein CO701_06900 [Citrobacter werkmanii]|nr:hypothetical protein CO701_06900 [Citrobacter werkmanii]